MVYSKLIINFAKKVEKIYHMVYNTNVQFKLRYKMVNKHFNGVYYKYNINMI